MNFPVCSGSWRGLNLVSGYNLRNLLSGENGPLFGCRCAYVLTRELTAGNVDIACALTRAGIRLMMVLCLGDFDAMTDESRELYQQLLSQQIPATILAPGEEMAASLAALS